MRGKLVVVLVAIVLLASACFWDQAGSGTRSSNDLTGKGAGAANAAPLHTRWSASLPNLATTIVQSDGGLIDVSDGETLTALDPTTGATVWSRSEPSGVKVSGATSDNNNIDVATIESATQTANLEVRDARTGATVSTTPIAPTGSSTPPGPPEITGITKSGPWVVTTWGGIKDSFEAPYITGLGGFQVTNLDNPALSWRYDGSIGTANYIDGYDGPVIASDRLYLEHTRAFYGAGSIQSTVMGWNLSGCTNQCAPLFETSVITTAPIAAQDGRAVYAATAAGFAAFDPLTGAKQWDKGIDGNTFSRVLAVTDTAEVVASFVSTTDGTQTELTVYPAMCLAVSCAASWTTSFPVDTYVTKAVVANGTIYAAVDKYDPSGKPMTTLTAYPLNCTNGCRPLSRTPVGDELTAGPLVSNGQVVYGTGSGKIVAVTP